MFDDGLSHLNAFSGCVEYALYLQIKNVISEKTIWNKI